MSTPSSGAAGIGAGGKRLDVHGDLGGISKIQQQLVVLYRQLGQLATRFTDSRDRRCYSSSSESRSRTTKGTGSARVECWHVFLAVQIALERGPATTAAAGSTADVRQEQGETAGNFQRTGPSGGSWFSEGADPQRTAGQARPKQQRSQVGGPFWRWKRGCPVGFGSGEDRDHSGGDLIGESADFGVLKGVKWQIPIFDGKATSWRRFEMEFLMAM